MEMYLTPNLWLNPSTFIVDFVTSSLTISPVLSLCMLGNKEITSFPNTVSV